MRNCHPTSSTHDQSECLAMASMVTDTTGSKMDTESGTARCVCPRGHEIPDLKQVIRTLDLSDAKVLCVYIVGSHLWETCRHDSDWDMVVVLNEPMRRPLNTHRGRYEAFIVSKEDYVSLIREHSLQVLITLWLPRELVLRENFDPRAVFKLDNLSLQKFARESRERDLRVAEKHCRKSDSSRAKKIVLHCLRYQLLCVQLKRAGRIHDYTVANAFRAPILETHSNEWEDLKAVFQPVLENTLAELAA